MLLRCGVLRAIPEVGFHDFKEQVVPALARTHCVKVVTTRGLTSRPIHSLKDYVDTLRAHHAYRTNGSVNGTSRERWHPQFAIQEPGSTVDPSAVLFDSVVLQGAVVQRGAVVVRSVVGRGVPVEAGQTVCDEIVA
jgi:NDP-sugar pyrophosphorylase family protein